MNIKLQTQDWKNGYDIGFIAGQKAIEKKYNPNKRGKKLTGIMKDNYNTRLRKLRIRNLRKKYGKNPAEVLTELEEWVNKQNDIRASTLNNEWYGIILRHDLLAKIKELKEK